MRKSCYGTPVGDYKGWHTTILYLLNTGVQDNDAEIALMALREVIENAVFESKRPMIIRFPAAAIDKDKMSEFRKCFKMHIMYVDTTEILFAGRTLYASSPIDAWRKYYPHATD